LSDGVFPRYFFVIAGKQDEEVYFEVGCERTSTRWTELRKPWILEC